MMTFATLHPQESMLQAAAFEILGKFLLHMQGQGLALAKTIQKILVVQYQIINSLLV
jgi:hypothetical protein